MSAGLDHEVRERVIAPVAAEFDAQAGELAGLLLARYVADLPGAFRAPETAEAARASVTASIKAIARALLDDSDAVDLPPETIAFTRDAARQGLPLVELRRTYRIGQEILWRELVPRLAAHAAEAAQLAAAVDICALRIFGWVDIAVMLAEEAYGAERERFARTAAAVCAETVAALLDGSLTDAALAGQRLRHDLGRTHVALWAWLDRAPDSGDAYQLLEAALVSLARAAGCGEPLLQPLGTYAVAGWVSAAAAPDMTALAAKRLSVEDYPGVRVAVGEPAGGVEGFRASHAQATSARHVATLARRPPGSVTRYESVALQALASTDVEHARAFVQRVLGPLAAGDDTALRLAATVRAYLDENASRLRAAKRLGIHENTVSYRVKQAEEILGRSVEEDTLNLRVALALAPVFRER